MCWTKEKIWQWYDQQPWIVGFNYVSSTSVNSTEMWQAGTFDAKTIERELGWASNLGFNACRVFMQYLIWKYESEGLKQRMNDYMEIAWKKGIRTMIVLFDDCNFDNCQPYLGPQLKPSPGIHNSRWTPSPGEALSSQPEEWALLGQYVKDILGHFAHDERILVWDLYNEPGNCGMAEKTVPLLKAAFQWAREMNPVQPLTSATWSSFKIPCDMVCCELSDIISFHCYGNLEATEKTIRELKKFGKPLFCTEWLHRPAGNRIETHLPLFKREKIGIFNWGLVCGKTQTHLNWETMQGHPDPDPLEWQHDLLHTDGSPYRGEELEILKNTVEQKNIYLRPVDMTSDFVTESRDMGINLIDWHGYE